LIYSIAYIQKIRHRHCEAV